MAYEIPGVFLLITTNNDIIMAMSEKIYGKKYTGLREDARGGNFGWRVMEGNHCHNPEDFCDTTGLIMPVRIFKQCFIYVVDRNE